MRKSGFLVAALIFFLSWNQDATASKLVGNRIEYGYFMGYLAEKLIVPADNTCMVSMEFGGMGVEGQYSLALAAITENPSEEDIIFRTDLADMGTDDVLFLDLSNTAVEPGAAYMANIVFFNISTLGPFSVPVRQGGVEIGHNEIYDITSIPSPVSEPGYAYFSVTYGCDRSQCQNTAPSFAKGADIEAVNDAPQAVAGWATEISPGVNDCEATQALSFVITTDNSSLFTAKPAIDPTTGDLSFTPAAGANGTAEVIVMLTDNGGTDNGGVDTSPFQRFFIRVTPPCFNTAPEFTRGGDIVIHEVAPQSFPAWATDIRAGSGDCEAGQGLSFIISKDPLAFFAEGPSIDPTTGDLVFVPAAEASGIATITIFLKDDGGVAGNGEDTSDFQTFTISMEPRACPNTAPMFKIMESVTARAGKEYTFAAWATDIQPGSNACETSQRLSFLFMCLDSPSPFAEKPQADPATGDLRISVLPDVHGEKKCIVSLRDDGGSGDGDVDISDGQVLRIRIITPGDLDQDSIISLSDALLGLQVLSGATETGIDAEATVSGDGRAGMADVLYILRRVSFAEGDN